MLPRHIIFSSAARRRGFTLLELTIAMVALAVLIGILVPASISIMTGSRISATRDQLKAIHAAVVGDDAQGTFGFVGDMGRLPQKLEELTQKLDQTVYSTAHTYSVGMGWNGPYLMEPNGAGSALKDAWGNALDYGAAGAGQIRSAGPDGQFGTGDDIVYPTDPVKIEGRLHVEVLRPRADGTVLRDPKGAKVTVYFTHNGAESSVTATEPPFVVESLIRGMHAVKVTIPTRNADGDEDAPSSMALARVSGNNQTQFLQVTLPEAGVVAPGSTNANSNAQGPQKQ